MDERRLIESIIAGDLQLFSCLISKYEKMAYTLALRIMGNREDAEEVTQDSFLKMYRALPDFHFESKFSSWFYKIVYHTALTALRGQRIFSNYEETEINDVTIAEQERATSILECKDRKKIISETLNYMQKDEALLLTLYYLQECSIEEINQITNLIVSNIKTKLFRARKHFYEILQTKWKNEIDDIL